MPFKPAAQDSSHDTRNLQAGPSGYQYIERDYPSILPAFRHERSQSRMILIEPLRTTTQTQIRLDEHCKSDLESGEKRSMRSSSGSSEGSLDKAELDESMKGKEYEQGKGMPFLIRPIPCTNTVIVEGGSNDRPCASTWLRTEDQATEWLSLFYGISYSTSCLILYVS